MSEVPLVSLTNYFIISIHPDDVVYGSAELHLQRVHILVNFYKFDPVPLWFRVIILLGHNCCN